MTESDLKETLARCLDGLQDAAEEIEDLIDEDCEINTWYHDIQSIYDKILNRYEN